MMFSSKENRSSENLIQPLHKYVEYTIKIYEPGIKNDTVLSKWQ